MDQASTLKRMAGELRRCGPQSGKASPRVISVTSGKGGVGKTNVAVNLAICMAKAGRRVVLLDADLGLGNVDVLLGLNPRFTLQHVLSGEMPMSEVLLPGPCGIMVLPAGSGVAEMLEVSVQGKDAVLAELRAMEAGLDALIIDTGAGISDNVLYFNKSAHDIILVTLPEPTAVTDAYAMIKVLNGRYGVGAYRLLVNGARDKAEAREVYETVSRVAGRFLGVAVEYAGCIMEDDNVPKAVGRQKAYIEAYPETRASRCVEELASLAYGWAEAAVRDVPAAHFWDRLLGSAQRTG